MEETKLEKLQRQLCRLQSLESQERGNEEWRQKVELKKLPDVELPSLLGTFNFIVARIGGTLIGRIYGKYVLVGDSTHSNYDLNRYYESRLPTGLYVSEICTGGKIELTDKQIYAQGSDHFGLVPRLLTERINSMLKNYTKDKGLEVRVCMQESPFIG